MVYVNGYSITHFRNRNQIVIGLPQTQKTITNTVEPIVDRQEDISDADAALVLELVMYLFKK